MHLHPYQVRERDFYCGSICHGKGLVFLSPKEVRVLLMNLFVFWILMSLFFGSRAAGRAFGFLFGIMAFFWVIRLLAGFGLMLLPIILVVVVLSKVVVPFVVTFLRHFQ
jgi:hypothetical protein